MVRLVARTRWRVKSMRGWMSGVPGWETSRPSLAVRFLLPRTVERVHNLRVAKPWKCRLGLHDWEVRENPETHDHYEVCLRCDADRDTFMEPRFRRHRATGQTRPSVVRHSAWILATTVSFFSRPHGSHRQCSVWRNRICIQYSDA